MSQDVDILRTLVSDQMREIDAMRAFVEKVYGNRNTLIKKAGSTGRGLALEAEELLYGNKKGRKARSDAHKQLLLFSGGVAETVSKT